MIFPGMRGMDMVYDVVLGVALMRDVCFDVPDGVACGAVKTWKWLDLRYIIW